MFRAKGALYESRYIRVSNRVELPHALPKVWSLFQDGAAVIQCVPGVELVEDKGEGVCTTKVEVRLGALGARFEGETTFAADWSSRAVTITGRAVEKVGGSKGRIGMLRRFQETDAVTEIHINTEVTLVGAAAHFTDAELIRERFNGLVGEFAQSLEDKLDAAALLDVLGRSGDAGESPCAPIAFSRIREFFFPSTSKRLKDPVAPLADLNVSRKAPTRDLSSSASWRR